MHTLLVNVREYYSFIQSIPLADKPCAEQGEIMHQIYDILIKIKIKFETVKQQGNKVKVLIRLQVHNTTVNTYSVILRGSIIFWAEIKASNKTIICYYSFHIFNLSLSERNFNASIINYMYKKNNKKIQMPVMSLKVYLL